VGVAPGGEHDRVGPALGALDQADELALEINLARGWDTQLDRKYNPQLYDAELDATRFHQWLRANAISLVGDAQLQGILFANGNFESTNGANIYGTVIADSGQLSGNAKFASPPQPPVGAPGAPVTTTTNTFTWVVPKGGWSQY
jgi:hypothetical protein